MKTKMLLVAGLLILIGYSAKAQEEGVSFGIRAGFNMQNFNGKDPAGDKLELNLVPRFHAGVVVEIPIAPEFYFQPGLLYTTKGAKSDEFLGTASAEFNLSYLELPLSFVYKPQLGDGYFFLGFGPYVSYGIGGKAKFNIANVSFESNIEFENDYEIEDPPPQDRKYFKPLDFGGNIFFGYELKNGISLQLNAQLGLAKINSDNTAVPALDPEFRNTGFGLSLGYNF